ncbi:MAG: redoxin domain-containing protein [Candidatus Binatia bacterium]
MLQIRFATTIIFLAFFISFAYAQLGPKDGANLNPTDLERVKVGDTAPDFTLENMDGKRTSLSDFRGNKNVVLVFYRGHW